MPYKIPIGKQREQRERPPGSPSCQGANPSGLAIYARKGPPSDRMARFCPFPLNPPSVPEKACVCVMSFKNREKPPV